MFFPFFSLCSMPCAGIGRSSGAGTDIAVGGRGHFDLGMLARLEKSIKVGEKHRVSYCAYAGINGIVSVVKIQPQCCQEVGNDATLRSGPTNSGCSGNSIQPCRSQVRS